MIAIWIAVILAAAGFTLLVWVLWDMRQYEAPLIEQKRASWGKSQAPGLKSQRRRIG